MRKIDLKTSSALAMLLLYAATAGVTALAQTGTKAGAEQSGVKSKAAPQASGELDDDFSPKAKSKAKPPGQPVVGNKGTSVSEEISDPLAESTPKTDSAPISTPAASAPPSSASANDMPKKAGVMRLCLAVPRAQVGASDTALAAEAVRNTLKSYFTGPTVEAVALTARLPSQALEEAKQGGCDYVLYSSLTHKKGGGGGLPGRALGNAASSAVWHIPGGTTAGAVARTAAIAGVYTAASMAGSIKAKDELTLGYRLEATDGARPPVVWTEKAKAKSDAEDVLTPLIEKAAEAVAAEMMKKSDR